MARSLDQHLARETVVEGRSRRRLDQATVRALGSALAALAIATVVVTESTTALHPEGTASTNRFESGTVTLVDDDAGRSLLDLQDMAPGRPIERCIVVTYAGTVLPVDVSLSVETTGDIAEYVSVEVERGVAGGFDSCEGFVGEQAVHDGTLAELAARDRIDIGSIDSVSGSMSFRFRLDLVDDAAAAGRSGTVDFVWEAVPG